MKFMCPKCGKEQDKIGLVCVATVSYPGFNLEGIEKTKQFYCLSCGKNLAKKFGDMFMRGNYEKCEKE